jgi:hypothetical protein
MGKKARKRARMNSSNSNMSSAPPISTDNLTYAIHSVNETIYGQHLGITGTSPLRLYMHIHYKLCIPFISTAQSCPKTSVVNYHTQVTKTQMTRPSLSANPGITGTSPLTPTHTLYNLQPRQYSPYIMYTSTPNIGFHSDPPPARSGQGQPIQIV